MKLIKLGLTFTLLAFIYSRAKGEVSPQKNGKVTLHAANATSQLESEVPEKSDSGQLEASLPKVSSQELAEVSQGGDNRQAQVNDHKATEQAWDSSIGHEDASRIALDVTNGIRIKDIVQPSTEYHFASFGRQDPFLPQIRVNRKIGQSTKDSEPGFEEIQVTSILQKYPFADLSVVGIWSPKGAPKKALVSTPVGEGVVIQMGDSIGMKAGKVIAISDDFVSVREFEISFDGTRQFQDLKLWITGKKPRDAEFIRLGAPENRKEKNEGGEPQRPVTPMAAVSSSQPPAPPAFMIGGGKSPQSMPSTYSRQISGDSVEKSSGSNMMGSPNLSNDKPLLPSSNTTGPAH